MTMFIAWRPHCDNDQNGANEFPASQADDLLSEPHVIFGAARFDAKTILVIADSVVESRDPSWVPPQFAEMILVLALSPNKFRDNQVGDLAEDFVRYRAKYGIRFAQLWYWREVLREVWSAIPKPILWGGSVLALIEEIIRRHM
jgi:hypothetical protein